MSEREEISRGLCAGRSCRAIAGLLGRAVSTISREVGNNGGRDVYRAIAGQERALDRARRPKQCLLAARPALRQTVLTLLCEEWSPEQIVGHLRRHHGSDRSARRRPDRPATARLDHRLTRYGTNRRGRRASGRPACGRAVHPGAPQRVRPGEEGHAPCPAKRGRTRNAGTKHQRSGWSSSSTERPGAGPVSRPRLRQRWNQSAAWTAGGCPILAPSAKNGARSRGRPRCPGARPAPAGRCSSRTVVRGRAAEAIAEVTSLLAPGDARR
ncbi:helix-turn-helix domain-containing protein [Streptomyces sp. P3]|uniref:helix-turn-helix domain-containing protein n=1 Tax=Streptomyces sp. P3 TaxID=2135430 RepID=UPI001C1F75F1